MEVPDGQLGGLSPAVVKGVVYIGSDDDYVYMLQAGTASYCGASRRGMLLSPSRR